MYKLTLLLIVSVVVSACSVPQCPKDMVQHGSVCSRCPEGAEKHGNTCITLDGGIVVEPVGVGDQGEDVVPATDDSGQASVNDARTSEGQADATSASATDSAAISPAMDGGPASTSEAGGNTPESSVGVEVKDAAASSSNLDAGGTRDSSVPDSGSPALDSGPAPVDAGPPYTGLPQQSYLKSLDSRSNDQFGSALALADGKLVVGAPGEDDPVSGTADVGNAYVFTQISGRWANQGPVPRYSSSDPRAHLGRSVSVSGPWIAAGGDRLVRLSFCAVQSDLTLACVSRATLNPPTGTFEDSTDTSFGGSVSLFSGTLVVGAPTYHERGGDGSGTVGAAFLFSLANESWQQVYRFYGESGFNGIRGMEYGAQVVTSGTTTAIGAPADWRNAAGGLNPDVDLSDSGAVFVYSGSGAQWTLEDRIKASNIGPADRFGAAIAMYQDTLVVGAPGEASSTLEQTNDNAPNAGAVYVFVRGGTMWSQQAYIKAPTPRSGDRFGASVAVYGDSLAVGTPGYNGAAGRVFVLRRAGTTWSHETYVEARTKDANDTFGASVAISDTHVMAGAPGESSDAQGNNVTQADEANNGANASGATYAFRRSP